jgi:DNA repair exonuclease SbcCD nuclease subunit
MSTFRILHLSDIHIGKTYKHSEDIAHKIISDIDHNGLCSLKSVVVTGDIFEGQVEVNEKLIYEAVCFFEIIMEQINLNQEEHKIEKSDFIFVPGNHDLIRVDDEEEKWSKYKQFLLKFYNTIPEYYDQKNFSVFKQYDNEKIVFIGFNSCQIEKKKVFDSKYLNVFKTNIKAEILRDHGIDKIELLKILENEAINEYDDFGYISMAQITDIERKVKKLDDYNVIALFHHHFSLFPEIAREFGDTSLIRNYTEFIHHLKYMNVRTVLHGHKHFDLERPFITEDYYDTTDSIIDVFSGGSVATARKERHTFSVIDFYDRKDDIKLLHNKFIYNDEVLSIVRKQIPPQNLAIRVVKLLEMLKTVNPYAYRDYTETVEKVFKIYTTCNEIANWVSEAITGFKDVYKFLDEDYRNILFLLYAINYRTLNYRAIVGKETSYFESASLLLRNFFSNQIVAPNFNISIDEYHSLFGEKRLKDVANICDQLLNTCTNKSTKLYLAFSMVGIFFSDLYLVMTEYADDFKESIKYKVNIKIEENKFHENVPAPRIVIQSDADRRSAYVQLLCNEATAHKMAVLFVKEFDLLINKFEDYFKLIGLKLYYLIPKIDKDNMRDTLDNYNFEAYIPTLLPLLTGDNIYPSKVVFARELIQNSIDAIAVREAKERIDFTKEIFVEIGTDENNKRYFKIRDYGTGMDRYKIERYFTSIGRSFYSGDEYEDLNISYKPISNFGIGFLSSFMVCQEIDVRTKYYLPNNESLKLHIPNYEGCFFIERDENIEIGTELKLYLDCDLENKAIVEYIKKIMLDIKYDIVIKNNTQKLRIPAYQIREVNRNEEFKFFIPFTENYEILQIDYEQEVLSGNFIKKYEYGMLICKHSPKHDNMSRHTILNAGILVGQASLNVLFGKEFNENYHQRYIDEREARYNDIIMNVPSNWIQIDVSREKLTGFSEHIKKLESNNKKSIGVLIAEALYKQILGFLKYGKANNIDLPVAFLQEVIQYSISFCRENNSFDIYKKLMELKYTLHIKFTSEGVTLEIDHRGVNGKNLNISFENELAKEVHEKWSSNLTFDRANEQIYINNKTLVDYDIKESYRFDNIYHLLEQSIYKKDIFLSKDLTYKFKNILNSMGSSIKFESNDIFNLFALFLVNIPHDELNKGMKKTPSIILLTELAAMQRLNIGDVENGNNQIVVRYDDLSIFLIKDNKAN